MQKFGFAQGGRREDKRFLTGEGRYVDDTAPSGALVAVFLRSPHAHAVIDTLDVSDALTLPGVRAVLTAADLEAAGIKLGMRGTTVSAPDGTRGAAPERPVLARDTVRYVGEAVACVIAETLAQARDATEAVQVSYTDLPAKTDLAPGGPQVHPEAPDNCAYRFELGDETAVSAALASAAHRVSVQVVGNRIMAASMEPRGAWAEWQEDRLHLCVNGQGVWNQKSQLAEQLGLPSARIRVTNPDVGGGFGMKAMAYPEYVVISHAARVVGAPVRWMSDRTEAMLSDHGARDLVSQAELGFDADLRLVAYSVVTLSNLGAYNSQFGQAIQSELFSKVVTGVYDIPVAHMRTVGVYTHTTQVDAYRGAGRPEAITVLESAMDHAAQVLGVDRFDLRRRSFIKDFPHRILCGEDIDVGDFPRVLARAEALADTAGFAARKAASQARGLLRGLGCSYYIEAILGQPFEAAKVVFHPGGGVDLLVGTQSNGQGHETVFAEFLAHETGIPAPQIRVVQGDSDVIAAGGGTGGSRSTTVQTEATRAVVTRMVAAFADFLTADMGARPDFDGQVFRAPGSNLTPGLVEAAELARAQGRDDLLSFHAEVRLPGRSFPNGAHICEVEIDPDTGAVRVDRYTIVDDFGTVLAPQLVEGQVHGGVVQGLGQALLEQVAFDDQGQLQTASFMDYAMPRATDAPDMVFDMEPVPTGTNALGMKGCGEAGTVGAIAAVSNAVRDALAERGVAWGDMPFTPSRVWQMLQKAG
jgi:aerobic carbon-monoxide dehydrogenase large subunit